LEMDDKRRNVKKYCTLQTEYISNSLPIF